jgi:hypothetical protein
MQTFLTTEVSMCILQSEEVIAIVIVIISFALALQPKQSCKTVNPAIWNTKVASGNTICKQEDICVYPLDFPE